MSANLTIMCGSSTLYKNPDAQPAEIPIENQTIAVGLSEKYCVTKISRIYQTKFPWITEIICEVVPCEKAH